MAVNDLTGQNIQDTYQKVIQTDGASVADGTGSLLPISFDGNNVIISGSLTATEYSVTSSVTNVVFQQQSGSTIFGDSSDDTHLFTGSLDVLGTITASSNISASDGYFNSILLPSTGATLSSPYVGRIVFDYSDFYTGHPRNYIEGNGSTITINAHSTLYIEADDIVRYIGSNNTANQHISGSPRVFIGPFSKTPKNNDGALTVWGNLATTSSVGHITASGNISSSGTIKANLFKSNGKTVGQYTGDTNFMLFGHANTKAVIQGESILLGDTLGSDGHVTSSGNIWQSGSSNQIIADGNISASGNIIANTLTGNIDGGRF